MTGYFYFCMTLTTDKYLLTGKFSLFQELKLLNSVLIHVHIHAFLEKPLFLKGRRKIILIEKMSTFIRCTKATESLIYFL